MWGTTHWILSTLMWGKKQNRKNTYLQSLPASGYIGVLKTCPPYMGVMKKLIIRTNDPVFPILTDLSTVFQELSTEVAFWVIPANFKPPLNVDRNKWHTHPGDRSCTVQVLAY